MFIKNMNDRYCDLRALFSSYDCDTLHNTNFGHELLRVFRDFS